MAFSQLTTRLVLAAHSIPIYYRQPEIGMFPAAQRMGIPNYALGSRFSEMIQFSSYGLFHWLSIQNLMVGTLMQY